MLHDYIMSDALLGKFFIPFIFEKLPATDNAPQIAYIEEVERCDIYIGLIGKHYGRITENGFSATETEYNHATKKFKHRLIFIKRLPDDKREPQALVFIKNVEQNLVRKSFITKEELKNSVYAALIRYLELKEFIRLSPFDAAINLNATINDLDEQKIREFIRIAKAKRAFPFDETSPINRVLTHLNLIEDKRVCNAAILLFGKNPQCHFLTSEIKCAHFHGIEVSKPIPSYQVFKGDVFQMIEQAVDFVLSKINLSVGSRDKGAEVEVQYELPVQAVTEAIVNAVAHRDYTSNASVQVMLFKDRLEIWNPGALPFGLTPEKLFKPHKSFPANPLLAEPMYLRGAIERMGTGTLDMAKRCKEMGLPLPVFIQEEDFRVILYRTIQTTTQTTIQTTTQTTTQTTAQTTLESKILNLIKHNKHITQAVIAENLDISLNTVKEYIVKMRKKGIIKRQGGTYGGYWLIINQDEE